MQIHAGDVKQGGYGKAVGASRLFAPAVDLVQVPTHKTSKIDQLMRCPARSLSRLSSEVCCLSRPLEIISALRLKRRSQDQGSGAVGSW